MRWRRIPRTLVHQVALRSGSQSGIARARAFISPGFVRFDNLTIVYPRPGKGVRGKYVVRGAPSTNG